MFKKSALLISFVFLILMIDYISPIHAGEQEITSSFEHVIKEAEKIIKSFPETVVYRNPGYRKEKITFKSISYDIQKTDSLISPYKGIIEFEVYWEFGPEFDTASQAERSETNARLIEDKHQIIYAYQKGKWIKKNVKSYSYYSDSWNAYTLEEVTNEYFNNGYPVLSLFPKLFLAVK